LLSYAVPWRQPLLRCGVCAYCGLQGQTSAPAGSITLRHAFTHATRTSKVAALPSAKPLSHTKQSRCLTQGQSCCHTQAKTLSHTKLSRCHAQARLPHTQARHACVPAASNTCKAHCYCSRFRGHVRPLAAQACPCCRIVQNNCHSQQSSWPAACVKSLKPPVLSTR